MARYHFGRWVTNYLGIGPTNAISDQAQMDDDRSQFPYDLNSGYITLPQTTVFTSMLAANFVSGPSVINFWFKPETLIITNKNGAANEVVFYDGQSASAGLRTIMDVIVQPSDTLFLARDILRGQFVVSGVFMSNLLSNVTIRIGGKLMQSIAGQL